MTHIRRIHIHILGFCTAVLLAGAAATAANAQSGNDPSGDGRDNSQSAPPPPSAQGNDDMECRRQAAGDTGYTRARSADRDLQQRYAAAYYGCMEASNGAAPPDAYAYGPPPGYYGPPPPPAYYGPDPYAYPYPYSYPYPAYGGPVVSFGFGFGGHRRW